MGRSIQRWTHRRQGKASESTFNYLVGAHLTSSVQRCTLRDNNKSSLEESHRWLQGHLKKSLSRVPGYRPLSAKHPPKRNQGNVHNEGRWAAKRQRRGSPEGAAPVCVSFIYTLFCPNWQNALFDGSNCCLRRFQRGGFTVYFAKCAFPAKSHSEAQNGRKIQSFGAKKGQFRAIFIQKVTIWWWFAWFLARKVSKIGENGLFLPKFSHFWAFSLSFRFQNFCKS